MVGQYITDHIFRAPAIAIALARAATGAPTWLYRFAWRSGASGQSSHCLDVPFWFDCLGSERVGALAGPTPPQELADAAHGSFVAFIRTGDPGWAAFDEDSRTARVLDVPVRDEEDALSDAAVLLPAPVA